MHKNGVLYNKIHKIDSDRALLEACGLRHQRPGGWDRKFPSQSFLDPCNQAPECLAQPFLDRTNKRRDVLGNFESIAAWLQGATLSCACDFRIAAADAKFGFVFGARGLTMEGCSSFCKSP